MLEKLEPVMLHQTDVRLLSAYTVVKMVSDHYLSWDIDWRVIVDKGTKSNIQFVLAVSAVSTAIGIAAAFVVVIGFSPWLVAGMVNTALIMTGLFIWRRDFQTFEYIRVPGDDPVFVSAARVVNDPRMSVLWELNAFISEWNSNLNTLDDLNVRLSGGLIPKGEAQEYLVKFEHLPEYIEGTLHKPLRNSLKRHPFASISTWQAPEITDISNRAAQSLKIGREAMMEYIDRFGQPMVKDTPTVH